MFGKVVNTSSDSPLIVFFIYNGCAHWTNIRYDILKLQYEIDWEKHFFYETRPNSWKNYLLKVGLAFLVTQLHYQINVSVPQPNRLAQNRAKQCNRKVWETTNLKNHQMVLLCLFFRKLTIFSENKLDDWKLNGNNWMKRSVEKSKKNKNLTQMK